MALFEDETVKKPARLHELGQDLSSLSIVELQERIAALSTEIDRLKAEIDSKGATRSAAEAFFRND